MTEKTFWLSDEQGRKARVFGAEARDQWVKVHGWSETTEPVGLEFQHVRNVGHGGRGVLNHEAAVLHEGLGWVPCGPPGYDDPAPKPEPKTTAKPGTSGEK